VAAARLVRSSYDNGTCLRRIKNLGEMVWRCSFAVIGENCSTNNLYEFIRWSLRIKKSPSVSE